MPPIAKTCPVSAVLLLALCVPPALSAQSTFECVVAQQSWVGGAGPSAGQPRPTRELMPEAMRQLRTALDSAVADAGPARDSVESVLALLPQAVSEFDLTGQRFTVHRATGVSRRRGSGTSATVSGGTESQRFSTTRSVHTSLSRSATRMAPGWASPSTCASMTTRTLHRSSMSPEESASSRVRALYPMERTRSSMTTGS